MSGACTSGHSGSYERLGSGPTLFDYSSMMQRARRLANNAEESIDSERQVREPKITFF